MGSRSISTAPFPSNPLGRFAYPQMASVEQQLKDGVRTFLIECMGTANNELRVSHSTFWNAGPLTHAFDRIETLLRNNPRELIVL